MKKDKETKVKKPRKYLFRRFVKEMKRVRWPSSRKNWVSFVQIVIFAFIFTLCAVLLGVLFSLILTKAGVK
ncbi:preprotein translocase subunit SecE [Mycoplasmopsis caviae]|uniref:Preprotein translocase subunit SecE n=1 Tax=Mycoplasmopsis caviae TaxID=55603 RepID=A0A3P8KB88_9BACT|nr:preprotein translocase subunit SecE [Mycoplasmopsis caviae]UUD35379.1 preprotein translocase subunit SecE [Mycoplasmopsis caviae]VDR41844.1 preprotein translocase subunit SecE [Mycoplasmopsis caviae]